MNITKRLIGIFGNGTFSKSISAIKAYKNIDGWLTEKEAFGLNYVAKRLSVKSTVVEIGSWKGKSTFCIAKGLRDGMIYAIDPFNAEGEEGSKEIYAESKGEKPLIEQFDDNMCKYGVESKVKTLKGYSKEFINEFSTIDFLFIDGDHSIEGCDFDYMNFSPFISKGGYLAFHDYYPDRDELGPTWVIKNRVLKSEEFKFHKQFDSLWIAQKIK